MVLKKNDQSSALPKTANKEDHEKGQRLRKILEEQADYEHYATLRFMEIEAATRALQKNFEQQEAELNGLIGIDNDSTEIGTKLKERLSIYKAANNKKIDMGDVSRARGGAANMTPAEWSQYTVLQREMNKLLAEHRKVVKEADKLVAVYGKAGRTLTS